jgi:uncharacterized membrane protein YeiH
VDEAATASCHRLTPEGRVMEKLPLVLDLTGTFVFALSGALAAMQNRSETGPPRNLVAAIATLLR